MQQVNLIIQLTGKSGSNNEMQLATDQQLSKLKSKASNIISFFTEKCLTENISCQACNSTLNIGIHIVDRILDTIEVSQNSTEPAKVFIKTEKFDDDLNEAFKTETYASSVKDEPSADIENDDTSVDEFPLAGSSSMTPKSLEPWQLSKIDSNELENINLADLTEHDYERLYELEALKAVSFPYYRRIEFMDGGVLHFMKTAQQLSGTNILSDFDFRDGVCDLCGKQYDPNNPRYLQNLMVHRRFKHFLIQGNERTCVACNTTFKTIELLIRHTFWCRMKQNLFKQYKKRQEIDDPRLNLVVSLEPDSSCSSDNMFLTEINKELQDQGGSTRKKSGDLSKVKKKSTKSKSSSKKGEGKSTSKKKFLSPADIPPDKVKHTFLTQSLATNDDFLQFYNQIQKKNPKLPYYEIFHLTDGLEVHCTKLTRSCKNSIHVATFDLRQNKCDVCSHPVRFQGLFFHRNLHFFEPRGDEIKCTPCSTEFATREQLEIHVNFCRKKKTYIGHHCKICNKKYKTHYNLREHEVSHFPDVNKQQKAAQMCEICSMVCPNIYRLRDHKRRKHKINQFVCNECGHKSPSITLIRQHLIRKHFPHLSEFVCEICSAPFSVEGMLNYHMKCAHSETYEVKCPLCDKVFKNGKNYLYAHMQKHKDVAERQKYYCDICNKVFMCKASLKKHRELHSDPETRKFECTTCKQRFSRETYLKQHVKAHHQLSFRCEFCGKMFGRKISLMDHRNTHTGERPYKCLLETCDQAFRDRGNFNQHLKKHEKLLGIKLTLTKEESRLKKHKLIDIKLDCQQ